MKESKKYIPLDKSWVIRMGTLDLLNKYPDINVFLNKERFLSEDLIALKGVCRDWNSKKKIDVGESGTLYRFLQFVSWKFGLDKEFITHGTLQSRNICDNPKIVQYSLNKLLKLDQCTSQWASAAVLCGNKGKMKKPPYKLGLTYEAVDHWQNQRSKGKTWKARYDITIENQAIAFLEILNGESVRFNPEQAEDYCFARAFGFITKEEGEKRWPSLRGHESDRIEEMETALDEYQNVKVITSKDHRVVQAVAMKAKVDRKNISFQYPNSVNKSWPQFWDFLENIEKIQ